MTRKFLHSCFTLSILLFSSIQAELPYPYNTLEEILPYNIHNSRDANEAPLTQLLQQKQTPLVIVELGSWFGASAIGMAKTAPEGSEVYAIDHWLGSAENHIRNDPNLPTLYAQFLSNVIHQNLTHVIIPVRMTTHEAAQALYITPDLVYVDASHDEASVYSDLCDWFPFVQGHGILCGDDWQWDRGQDFPVRKAVRRFAEEHHLSIEVINNRFWRLHES